MITTRQTIKQILSSEPQKELFEKLSGIIQKQKAIVSIIQRGSFSKNQNDRASDLDMLLIIKDADFKTYLSNFNKFFTSLPLFQSYTTQGWYNHLTPNWGGVGLIFLVQYKNKLVQIDLFIMPEFNSKRILGFPEKKILFERRPPVYAKDTNVNTNSFAQTLVAYREQQDTTFQTSFEVLLMFLIYIKQIYRFKSTLACRYRYLSIECLGVFLRLIYVPEKIGYRMYDWEKDFANFQAPVIRKYERSIENINIYSDKELFTLIEIYKTALTQLNPPKTRETMGNIVAHIEEYARLLLSTHA